jgi:hypothetical protein
MKSTLSEAGKQAMTWMIGFKRNENSNLRRELRMLANKTSMQRSG